jgi:hypothetical protein
MDKRQEVLPLEYQYSPSQESEERLAQAYELILALILEDYENEQKSKLGADGEPC